ncbi:MAG: response regulator, partial [Chloroflexota bacterium]
MEHHGRIKVIVADDHTVFRMGMRELLQEDQDLEVVAEASSGDEALAKALEFKPDVVIMDVRMPGGNGIDATRHIKEELPHTEVVVVSAVADEEQIFQAIEAGASGYLNKDDEPEMMIQAVHSASEGKAFLPPPIAKRVLDRFAGGLSGRLGRRGRAEMPLTDRETMV